MNIDVFITDADYVVREGKPFIRLYGRTQEGKSAIVLDGSFFPYFYVVPKAGIKQDELNTLKKNIEKIKVLGSPEKVSDETSNGGEENSFADDDITVKSAELVEKKIGADKITLLKVTANIPAHIPYLKSAVHDSSATAKYISGVREYDIPFYKRYFFDRGFSPLSWVSVEGAEISKKENEARFGYLIDILVVSKSISASKKADPYNGHKMAAFDLETIEEDKKLKIIMASIAATGGYAKVISYEKNGFPEEIFLKSEKELIATLSSEIVAQDPDFIITYNGDAFDFAVLDTRSKDLKQKMIAGRDGKPLRFQKKGRIKAATVKGMPHIDLFNFVSRVMSPAMSSETLSLDSVATEIIGEGKKGFTWDQMKDAWINKKKLYELADYCMQDSLLTLKLAERITPNIFALSKLTSQLPADASRMTYGQLVESYAMKKASQMNIVVPNKPSYDEIGERKGMEQYAGGFVKEPRAGLHESIAVFDFRGLYPSIIVTHNVDPHTLNCPCCGGREENKVPGSDNYFCTKNRGFIPEILVELFEERKALKQKMKALDKKSKEYHEINARQFAVKTVSNAMYGYLGFAGSRWYNRDCASAVTAFARHYIQKVISMAEEAGFEVLYGDSITADRFVTIRDKNGLVEIKNIEELFLDNKEQIQVLGRKELIYLTDYEVLTLNPNTRQPEWGQISQIIRHKTSKKIFRVNQKYGETIVTEDHSIITDNMGGLEETRPCDMINKKMVAIRHIPKLKNIESLDFYELLSHYSNKTIYKKREKTSVVKKIDNWLTFSWTNRKSPIKIKQIMRVHSKEFESLCRLIGAYISEGSSSTIETTKTKFGASIASSDIKWLEQLKTDYLTIFKDAKASIIKSTKKRRVLKYRNGTSERMVEYEDGTHKLQMMNGLSAVFFKMLCGQKSYGKKIPEFIYHVPEKYQRIVLENMIKGDGSRIFMNRRLNYSEKYKQDNFRYETRSLHLISGLSFLLNLLGQKYTIRFRPGKRTYILTTASKNNSKLFTVVTEEKYVGYVYDLNVEGSHMFVDSCGQVLLHNTDSVFLHIENEIESSAQEFLKKVNAELPGIIELDFQGIYVRGLFVSRKVGEGGAKKRYALIDKEGNVTIRGFEKVRRDWSKLAKDTQEKVLELVLNKRQKEAVELVKKTVIEIKTEKVDMKELRIYTQLTRQLKNYVQIGPHVAAVKKAVARGKEILPGETIEYVITKGTGSISDRAELIEYAKNYDPEYYINNQIVPAALRVLHIFGVNEDDLLGRAKQKGLSGWGKK